MKKLLVVCMLFSGCAGYTPNTDPDLFVSPTVTTSPATMVECPTGGIDVTITSAGHTPQVTSVCNGATGATGQTGATGAAGRDGTNGSNGTNGTNGTVITPVQFCPGVDTYPSEFNEVGLCINGNVYAVYSANDGFMSMIPPGIYSSNGINASCTFTVGANCAITH